MADGVDDNPEELLQSDADGYEPHDGEGKATPGIEGNLDNPMIMVSAITRTMGAEDFDRCGLQQQVDQHHGDERMTSRLELMENLIQTCVTNDENALEVDFRVMTGDVSIDQQAFRLEGHGDDDQPVPNRYDIIESLGSGGNGQVFSVYDNNFECEVAAKFLHPRRAQDPDKLDQFIREARITAALSHPNILPVHDINISDGGMPYFTMRKADGIPMSDAIRVSAQRGEPLPEIASFYDRAGIMIKVCDAIAYAHSQGVIHQDIKPDNIILDDFGTVILIDWGTANTERDRSEGKAKIQGTPAYMAPEQARRENSTEASDIYCLGCTLFHLLTLRLPTWSDDASAFWELKRKGSYLPPTEDERRRIPAQLLAIAEKAIAPEPVDRYADVVSLRDDLRRYQEGLSVSAYDDSMFELARRLYRRNRPTVWVTVVAAALLSIGAWLYYEERAKEFSRWHPVYAESFDQVTTKALAAHWYAHAWPGYQVDRQHSVAIDSEVFSVNDGALTMDLNPIQGACTNLIFQQPVPGNMRMSWTVTPLGGQTNLNCFIAGENRWNGYTIHVGGYNDSRLLRCTRGLVTLDQTLMDRPLELDRPYRFQVERVGTHIRFSIDGQLMLDAVDYVPLTGQRNQRLGIEISHNQARIDDIAIERQALPEKIATIAIADSLYGDGHITDAASAYRSIIEHFSDSDMIQMARFRLTRCQIELGHYELARNGLLTILADYPDHEVRHGARLSMLRLHLRINEQHEAEALATRIARDPDSPPALRRQAHSALISAMSEAQRVGRSVESITLQQALDLLDYGHTWSKTLGVELPRLPETEGACKVIFNAGYIDLLLERYARIDPFSTGQALLWAGRYQEAFDNYGYNSSAGIKALQLLGRHQEVVERWPADNEYALRSYVHLGLTDQLEALRTSSKRVERYLLRAAGKWEELLAIEPSNISALTHLGRLDEIIPSLLDGSFKGSLNTACYAILEAGRTDVILASPLAPTNEQNRAHLLLGIEALTAGNRNAAQAHLAAIDANPAHNRHYDYNLLNAVAIPLFRYQLDGDRAALDATWNSIATDPRHAHFPSSEMIASIRDGSTYQGHPWLPELESYNGHATDQYPSVRDCLLALHDDFAGNTSAAQQAYRALLTDEDRSLDVTIIARLRLLALQ